MLSHLGNWKTSVEKADIPLGGWSAFMGGVLLQVQRVLDAAATAGRVMEKRAQHEPVGPSVPLTSRKK